MTIRSILFTAYGAAWLTAAWPALAEAQDGVPPLLVDAAARAPLAEDSDAAIEERALTPEPVASSPAPAEALSSDALAGLSGADGAVAAAVTLQNLQAVNTGNRIEAGQVVTGSISLNSSALSGFSGVGNFVMNTGNNNNIQSTMSVSVVTPPR